MKFKLGKWTVRIYKHRKPKKKKYGYAVSGEAGAAEVQKRVDEAILTPYYPSEYPYHDS